MIDRTQDLPTVRFVGWWSRLIPAAVFGGATVALARQAWAGRSLLLVALISAIGIALLVVAMVRALRAATVELRSERLLVRDLYRTRCIPWSEIRGAGVTDRSTRSVRWRTPFVELVDGRVIRFDELRGRGSSRRPDDIAAAIDARIG